MEVARQRSALALRGFPVGIESGGLSAIALRVGSTLILFTMWEFFGRRINPILFSSPTAVLKAGGRTQSPPRSPGFTRNTRET